MAVLQGGVLSVHLFVVSGLQLEVKCFGLEFCNLEVGVVGMCTGHLLLAYELHL